VVLLFSAKSHGQNKSRHSLANSTMFQSQENRDIPFQDVLSWVFGDVSYATNKPVGRRGARLGAVILKDIRRSISTPMTRPRR
jgi:hypothetical protein